MVLLPARSLPESFERAALRHRFLTMVVTPYVLIATVAKPMHTLLTAAAAVGRNKSAILRAIKAGKIPVSQAGNGEMQIDPADLHRIYPPLRTNGAQQQQLYQSPLLLPLAK